ncbi:MAG: cardiolipin synthase ClsB [Candidatus Schekmanbacteria bacterium]|nr:cardiolipin synthase ClsB [Candidatus Schekmanbacteria bacterium]
MRVGTHRISLLIDGAQTYAAMIAALAEATWVICLETYIFREDEIGRGFAEVLIDRALRGVQVNLLLDAWGTSLSSPFLGRLEECGVRAHFFNPIRFHGPLGRVLSRLRRRNHSKVLLIDGVIGFVGGQNIGREYAGSEHGGGNWRDTHTRIEGPAVKELTYFFSRRWARAGGQELRDAPATAGGRRPDPHVKAITSDLRRSRRAILRAYVAALRTAQRRLFITNAYFLPPGLVLRALCRAARRGVDVRIILAGSTDVLPILLAARHVYGRLLAAGVRLYEWQGRILHAKTATVDGFWSTVGSANLDFQSLRRSREVNIVISSEDFAAQMERLFLEDVASCEEVTMEAWQRRSLSERIVSWIAFWFREWL